MEPDRLPLYIEHFHGSTFTGAQGHMPLDFAVARPLDFLY